MKTKTSDEILLAQKLSVAALLLPAVGIWIGTFFENTGLNELAIQLQHVCLLTLKIICPAFAVMFARIAIREITLPNASEPR